MDILEKYEKENPQLFSQTPSGEPSEEYGVLPRLVIRFFGGRIENERQANFVLVIVAVLLVALSAFFLSRRSGSRMPSMSEMLRDTPRSGLRPGAIVPQ